METKPSTLSKSSNPSSIISFFEEENQKLETSGNKKF